MALTLKTNGSSGSNIIQASWWNDYYNLLTGSMNDQYININNGLTLKQLTFTPPTAPTLALASGSGLGTGSYTYGVAYTNNSATSKVGVTATITTTAGNNQVNLATIPTGPAGVTGRNIYRSKVGTSSPLYKVASINDNTTTTFTDTIPDASLGGPSPAHDFLGGSLIIKDQNSNFKAQIYADGAIWLDSGGITSDGLGNLVVGSITTGSGNLTIGGTLEVNSYAAINDTPSNQAILEVRGTPAAATTAETLQVIAATGQTPNIFAIRGPSPGFSLLGGVKSDGTLFNNVKINFDTGKVTSDGAGTLTAAGLLTSGGLLGKSAAGDIIDASGTITYVKGSAAVALQAPNGTSVLQIQANSVSFPSYLGFKTFGGTKLAEIKNNGNFYISGTTYYTTQATAGYSSGGAFDAFDFSEVYEVTAEYPIGTVVCPADTTTPIAYDGTPQAAVPVLSQCTHPLCTLAGVIVAVPAFCAGSPNVPSMGTAYDSTKPMKQAVAQIGRVFALSPTSIPGKTLVCSDGAGNVRAMVTGDKGMALGVSLSPTASGKVPILVRPTYASL